MARLNVAVARRTLLAVALVGALSWGLPSRAEDVSTAQPVELEADVEMTRLARHAHESVNQYRRDRDLPPLSFNIHISQQAAIHSQNMAQQVVKFSHQGFKHRVEALESQIVYLRAAENVAYNQGYQDPVQQAIASWLDSENHHKHIIGDFNLTGIGVAKNERGEYYFTQIFIKD